MSLWRLWSIYRLKDESMNRKDTDIDRWLDHENSDTWQVLSWQAGTSPPPPLTPLGAFCLCSSWQLSRVGAISRSAVRVWRRGALERRNKKQKRIFNTSMLSWFHTHMLHLFLLKGAHSCSCTTCFWCCMLMLPSHIHDAAITILLLSQTYTFLYLWPQQLEKHTPASAHAGNRCDFDIIDVEQRAKSPRRFTLNNKREPHRRHIWGRKCNKMSVFQRLILMCEHIWCDLPVGDLKSFILVHGCVCLFLFVLETCVVFQCPNSCNCYSNWIGALIYICNYYFSSDVRCVGLPTRRYLIQHFRPYWRH